MGNLEQFGLPADFDCETFVLGAVLRDFAKFYPQVADMVAEEDFSNAVHRTLWKRIVELRTAGEPVDRVTVFKRLAKFNETETVGGLGYLTTLDDGLPPVPNVGAYAARVREKSTLRRAIVACQSTIERLSDPRATADDVMAAERVIRKIAEGQTKKRRLVSIAEVIQGQGDGDKAKIQTFLQPGSSEVGLSVPWRKLMQLTGGLKPGHLIILAARPSVGKTTAATQMALHAGDMDSGVVLVSLEMPATDIVRKMVAVRANVSLNEWVNGECSFEERRAIASQSAAMRSMPIWLDDQPRATAPGIHAAILRHKSDHEVRLVVIDYLQLLTAAGRGSTRTEDVSEITRDLKLMAMELNVPVVALSQLSRASEQQNRRPRLSDLRDSGSIEQDADEVMFLHRVEKPFVELILAKQRLGPTGEVRLSFDRRAGLFTEVEGAQ